MLAPRRGHRRLFALRYDTCIADMTMAPCIILDCIGNTHLPSCHRDRTSRAN
jgi:hypothetical protein